MLLSVRRPRAARQLSSDFATAKAILNFYEQPQTTRSLSNYLGRHNYGSLVTELAECLHQHGVKATLVTANPNIFERASWDKFRLRKHGKSAIEELQINEYTRVIEAGVLLRAQVPTEEIIDQSIHKHHPVIISLSNEAIRETLGSMTEFGIITGYDHESYTVVDFGSVGRARRFPKQLVIFALHSLSSEDPTSGTIILTSPQRKKN